MDKTIYVIVKFFRSEVKGLDQTAFILETLLDLPDVISVLYYADRVYDLTVVFAVLDKREKRGYPSIVTRAIEDDDLFLVPKSFTDLTGILFYQVILFFFIFYLCLEDGCVGCYNIEETVMADAFLLGARDKRIISPHLEGVKCHLFRFIRLQWEGIQFAAFQF